MIELKVLQAIRLKGRVQLADIAATVDERSDAVTEAVAAASQSGYIIEGKTIRLSEEGRARLRDLLNEEREKGDKATIESAYKLFRGVNSEFKALISEWQLKDGEPNSHADPAYDAAVLSRVEDVHERLTGIVSTVNKEIPRLAAYSVKLSDALSKVLAGDTAWLTRPIVDSYHTVWFELHEELILAAGLTREAEANAGHAQ